MKSRILLPLLLLATILAPLSWASTSDSTLPGSSPAGSTNTLMAVGDIAFIYGNDAPVVANPERPWVNLKPVLGQADLLMGNLEVPLSWHGAPYTQKKYILRSDPRVVNTLIAGGFDVVTLANNHMMDYGPTALSDTLNLLDSNRIAHTGAGLNLTQARQAAFLTTPDGTRVAFLSYSLTYPEIFWATASRAGTPYGSPDYFIPDIKAAKARADLVIVSFHWSDERITSPFPYQKTYGRQCIDAGAAVVIGHHPHVLQGFEVYRGGLIAYSLGNFVFGSPSVNTSDTIILGLDYNKSGLLQAKLYPINVNYLQPMLRSGSDAERLLQNLRYLSAQFGTVISNQNGLGIIKLR